MHWTSLSSPSSSSAMSSVWSSRCAMAMRPAPCSAMHASSSAGDWPNASRDTSCEVPSPLNSFAMADSDSDPSSPAVSAAVAALRDGQSLSMCFPPSMGAFRHCRHVRMPGDQKSGVTYTESFALRSPPLPPFLPFRVLALPLALPFLSGSRRASCMVNALPPSMARRSAVVSTLANTM